MAYEIPIKLTFAVNKDIKAGTFVVFDLKTFKVKPAAKYRGYHYLTTRDIMAGDVVELNVRVARL